ncbi:MAG: CoA transferase [Dehalococcoidia bacterium]|jgi:crotonobetainyl-CoA:carnitine CoA-transferase CaiB-like acyl-CoA transferase|nr:CoA transferase [Dehalococcoidia bacterium]MDP7469422.1 CoA transferase [Dehalococcoidia bacterium]
MAGPLEGIKILEWAMYHNGPAAGYMLGDLGAEVIKIEQPVTGDYCRGVQSMFDSGMGIPGGGNAQFETANRNKKGIILDLHQESGRQVLYKLVETADVFYTNFRKSVAQKLKVDYASLKQHNPKLIYADNSAYGNNGQWSGKRGFDPVAQALSGAMWMFGDRDDTEPSMAVGGIFDQTGATLLAYGIMAALLARERTGVAQEIECSLLGGGIHMQAINVNAHLWRGRGMARHSRKRARSTMSNYYKCADDKWMLLTEPQSERFWHDFCTALNMPEVETHPKYATPDARKENYAEMNSIVENVFATKTRQEWLDILGQYQFAHAPIFDYDEMSEDPQVLGNEYLVEMDHPTMGKVKTLGFPVKFSETPARIQSPAPEFGQHTEDVLLEAGYSWEDIAVLRERGALG